MKAAIVDTRAWLFTFDEDHVEEVADNIAQIVYGLYFATTLTSGYFNIEDFQQVFLYIDHFIYSIRLHYASVATFRDEFWMFDGIYEDDTYKKVSAA